MVLGRNPCAGVVFVLLTAGFGCAEPAGPVPAQLDVRIVGPSVVVPGDSATLYGIANHSRLGALPPDAFTWTIDTDVVTGSATVRVAALPSPLSVRLIAMATDGERGEATFTVSPADADTVMWEVDLQAPPQPSPRETRFSSADGRLYVSPAYGDAGRVVVHAGRGPAAAIHPLVEFDPDSRQVIAIFPNGDRLRQTDNVSEPDTVLRIAADGSVRWVNSPTIPYAQVALVPGDSLIYRYNSSFGIGALGASGEQGWELRGDYYSGLATDDRGRWLAWDANPTIVVDVGRSDIGRLARASVGPSACRWVRAAFFGGGDALYVLTSAQSSSLTAAHCVTRATLNAAGVAAAVWTATMDFEVEDWNLAVGRDGTLYFGLASGSVVALGPDGVQRWRSPPITTECDDQVGNTPALGEDGTIFHVAYDRLIVLAPDGTARWTDQVADDRRRNCYPPAPLLTDDGRLFVVTNGFRIRAYRTGIAADPQAVWGQAGSDSRRSGQARVGG
jgi:hypothetical protein